MVYDRVRQYCDAHAINIAQFERMCKLANGVVGRWNKFGYEPRAESLRKIVKNTGVPLKWWLS